MTIYELKLALQRLWNYPAHPSHPDSPLLPHPDAESIISEGDLSIGGISENILDHSLSLKSAPIGPGIIETLQAQLKQREGELFQLKAERNTNQQQREKLAAEVVRLSALADKVDELTQNNQVYYSLSFP